MNYIVYMISEARKNCWFTFQPCLLSSLIKSTFRQPTGLPTNNATIVENLLRLLSAAAAVNSTHLKPFSKSKFHLKSDRVNLVAPASPIECLLYLTNVRAIQ